MKKEDLKEFYWNRWYDIKENRKKFPTSWQLLSEISKLSYETVKYALDILGFPLENIVFISIGSLAREQMSPFSDIDVLLLHEKDLNKIEQSKIYELTTLLWDINLNPAIQIKSIQDITNTTNLDTIEKTALIDYRYLEGNKNLFKSYEQIVNSYIIEKGKTNFLLEHINVAIKRGEKFRDSIYKLEPNLKEGLGGIRDFNFICWINRILFGGSSLTTLVKKGIISVQDFDNLMKGIEFIFRVRNELHYYFNRKSDILTLEAQKAIASELGYITTSTSLNVEHFLRNFYQHARDISLITKKVINKGLQEVIYNKTERKSTVRKLGYGLIQYNNYLTAENKDIFVNNNELLIKVFEISAIKSLKLSDRLIELIRDNLYLINETFLKRYGKVFVKTISRFPYSYKIVKNMFFTGVLEKIIPEFKEINCRVQYDLYHHYTVDEHTILALKYIDDLVSVANPLNNVYLDAYRALKRKDLLALSILLHDIGKGQGFNHSVVGAKMSQVICRRLNLHPDDIDTVSNMVEQHLLMSHIAQRRDLHDLEVIEYFTNFLNNEDELHLLYLLTYADMKAVGGAVFNDWKSSLLTELYLKSKVAMEKESLISEYNIIINNKRKKLYERVTDNIIRGFIDKLDSEYVFTYKVKHIIRHLQMIKQLNPDINVIVDYYSRNDLKCIEFNICTYDFLGLLKKLAGVFAYYGLNILGAQIFTFENNVVIDTIQVESLHEANSYLLEKGEKISKTIKDVISNKVQVEELVKKAPTTFFKKKIPKEIKKKVEFDNEISSNYTVIDVYTEDKIGLLYKILSVFEDLGINVQKAKISTDVDRVVDSFYVTDKNYNKITEQTFIDKIKLSLMEVI